MHSRKIGVIIFVAFIFGWNVSAQAQDATEDNEVETLRRMAEALATERSVESTDELQKTFKSGSIGLQALNPEISVTGDFLGMFLTDETQSVFNFAFRGLGLHFESYLDPYSRFKAAVPVFPGGADLGEAYFTRYGVFEKFDLTIGKFRQHFGVVNRWHKHALDYADFPLPLRLIFDNGGLNQTGVSLDCGGTIGNISQELTLQITNAENARIFDGNTKGSSSALMHYKLYRDISENTYCELGLTGLWGNNDTWEVLGTPTEDTLLSSVYGLNFTLFWEPAGNMRYNNIEWRSELYYLDRDVLAPDGSGIDSWNPWGAYTSLQGKVSRTVDVGFRFDYFQADARNYGATTTLPFVSDEEDANCWLATAYVTWAQSPFVKYRVNYEYEDGTGMGTIPQSRVTFQLVFGAGPHKHERY